MLSKIAQNASDCRKMGLIFEDKCSWALTPCIIKGFMEKKMKNLKNRLILFKTFTNVEFYGEDNEINRNIEKLMTIALWEFFWLNVFNSFILRITRVCMLPWHK